LSLLSQEEAALTQSKPVEQSFNEIPTRNAFSAVLERLNDLEKMLASTHSDITTLKRQTKSFSPSQTPSKRPCLNFLNSTITTATTQSQRSLPTPCPPTSPQIPSSLPILSTTNLASQTSTAALNEVIDSPAPIPSNQLTPVTITTSDYRTYQVLRLSSPHSTLYDLILPLQSAFQTQQYPLFTTENCSWQAIFDKIAAAAEIWTTYAPGNLGDYKDIQSLWTVWDEGTYIPGVGRKAAIRIIDSRWGNLKSLETKHGRLPSWRLHNDAKVMFISSRLCMYCYLHICSLLFLFLFFLNLGAEGPIYIPVRAGSPVTKYKAS